MSGRTPRFGFNWFDGDAQSGALSDDGAKFTGDDRLLLDRLLAAIETHDHASDTDSDDAPDGPTLTYASTGGALEAGLTYYYKITFVDAAGLETDASDEVSVDLPAQLDAPAAPGQDTATTGTLVPGLYYYALTAVRGSEESSLGDPVAVTVLSDEHQVDLSLPALGAATSFRLWRLSDTEGFWRKFSDVITGSTFTDGGSATPVATDAPTANTGVATYAVTLDLSTDDATAVQATAVSGWKIYRSTTSGTYGGNSLVHYVTEHEIDTDDTSPKLASWVDTGDALLSGAPPVTASKMHFTTIAGGGGGGFTVLGDWDPAATYSAGDIVTRNGTHYRATGAVPAAQDPWANTAPATVDTERAATYQTATSSFGVYNVAQGFTVGASDVTVDTLHISTLTGYGVGGADVGIATAIGATTADVVWLDGAGPVASAFPDATTEFAVTLPSTVTLRAGQTYYVVGVSTSGSGARNWKFHQNHLQLDTGDIASADVLKSTMTTGGSWAGGSSPQYGLVWRLSEHTAEPPYWRALVPPMKGTWSPDAVYSAGETAAWGAGLFRSLEDGNTGYAPALDSHTASWQITSDGTDRLGTATDQAQLIQFATATNVHAIQVYLGSGTVSGRLTVKLVKATGTGPADGTVVGERTVDVAGETGWKIVSFGRALPVDIDTSASYYVVAHGLTVGSVGDANVAGDSGFLEWGDPILEGSSYSAVTGYYMMMTVEAGPSTPWELVALLVPPGGATGQVLTKMSGRDGDFGWA